MGRYENNVQRAADTMASHARQPPGTAEHRNSTTADGADQSSQTALHYTWTNQETTNQHRHEHADYMSRI